jgi:hypothetical protein
MQISARVVGLGSCVGNAVISRNYFTRQATTLLKFAQSTSDPNVVAGLVEKAADLKSRVDETSPPPDQGSRAPDIEGLRHFG